MGQGVKMMAYDTLWNRLKKHEGPEEPPKGRSDLARRHIKSDVWVLLGGGDFEKAKPRINDLGRAVYPGAEEEKQWRAAIRTVAAMIDAIELLEKAPQEIDDLEKVFGQNAKRKSKRNANKNLDTPPHVILFARCFGLILLLLLFFFLLFAEQSGFIK